MNALILAAAAVAIGILVALIGMLTARDDGSAGRPRWPARYPARPRLLVGDDQQDATARRWGWEPSDDETGART
jgi:hypothetical protein